MTQHKTSTPKGGHPPLLRKNLFSAQKLREIGCQAERLNKEEATGFVITIEQDEDGMFVAECPTIPECISQGKTRQEASGNIRDAIKQTFSAQCTWGSKGQRGCKGTLGKLITRAGIIVEEFLEAMK